MEMLLLQQSITYSSLEPIGTGQKQPSLRHTVSSFSSFSSVNNCLRVCSYPTATQTSIVANHHHLIQTICNAGDSMAPNPKPKRQVARDMIIMTLGFDNTDPSTQPFLDLYYRFLVNKIDQD